jgi:thiamine pyrophosphate-dependent acetolactate synthase large subunit-like protein
VSGVAGRVNARTCGQAIVALLEAYGVDTVFGIPGVHTLELYRGLVNSRIRHVLPRHEQGAGFMADGYARATGKPGVCFLITGPGLTNAATAIAQAYSDSVPMLVLSSVNPLATLGRGMGELHELRDQQQLMSGCTAFSARADNPEAVPGLLARAFALFAGARPRPVHIEVPIDIFERPVTEDWTPSPAPVPPQAAHEAIAGAARWLATAKSPAIVVGGGARHAGKAVGAIAKRIAAPVVSSVAGIGIFPSSHPLSLGPTLVSAATRQFLREADVVLAAGTELSTTDTWSGRLEFSGRLIRIDIDPAQFANAPKADIAIVADAGPALEAIASSLPATVATAGASVASAHNVANLMAAWRDGLGAGERRRKAAFEAITAATPADTMFVTDMTQIAYTAHTVFRSDTPGRFFHPQGYGTLGFALPAALGVKLGKPRAPVVALAGDGGILYTISEMATAADERIPVVVVLWNNRSLQQIREGFLERGIEPVAVSPKAPDFGKLAEGFGWHWRAVESIGDIGPAMREALALNAPALVEIRADAPAMAFD